MFVNARESLKTVRMHISFSKTLQTEAAGLSEHDFSSERIKM